MVSYEGIFFDEETTKIIHSLESPILDNVNDIIHFTFKYRPKNEEIFNEIVGKKFDIYLVGYANDGKNSGFQISFPKELEKYYINFDEDNPSILKIPHITASLKDGAKGMYTKNLKFKPLVHPVKLTGTFGFWIKEDNKEYLSFSPYIIPNKR